MKIYTKTGDSGETGLVGGKRLGKDSLRIRAYGDVDELNALLGVCRAHNAPRELDDMLKGLQHRLFDLGSDLATPLDSKVKVPRITEKHVGQMESWIDSIDERVAPLTHFILPGGCPLAARLHAARTVCRRAERGIVALQKEEPVGPFVIQFVNRLGDLLFMMARLANSLEGSPEEPWEKE